ncbi:MAG: DMT family transporter [Desulforhopalus sp.]|nr:DMT family transporter [Desulforhopalus sp.]
MSIIYILLASLMFACMGVCVKLASGRFSAAEIIFYRGFISLLLVAAWMSWRRLSPRTPHLRTHVSRSLAGTVSLFAYFLAITMIPLATAVTLNYTSPLFLALLLVFWVGQPSRRGMYVALGTGFLGIVLLLKPTFNPAQWLGGVLGLASGMIAAIAYLNVRKLGELGEPEWRTVFWFSAVTSLVGLPWLLIDGSLAHDLTGWLLVIGVGAFGATAQLCMTAAYKLGETLTIANLAYCTVVFASLFGMILWNENLSPAAWLGISLIVGSGVATTRLARSGKR